MGDPMVKIIGYQVNFDDLQEGFFLFNHHIETCHTTLSVPAKVFFDLYKGVIFQGRLADTTECSGFCLHRDNLKVCPAKCECSFVREILQTVEKWPKRPVA